MDGGGRGVVGAAVVVPVGADVVPAVLALASVWVRLGMPAVGAGAPLAVWPVEAPVGVPPFAAA